MGPASFPEGMALAGWLVVWGFAARVGWSTAGWLRRRLLSDVPKTGGAP